MSNIAINYIILKHTDSKYLSGIINGCTSNIHKIHLQLNDFSLEKKTSEQIKDMANDKLQIETFEYDYEDSNNATEIVLKHFTSYCSHDILSIVYDNLTFYPGLIDNIDFNQLMKNEMNGFIYGDYDIGRIKCYLRSHAAGLKLNIPFAFWSIEKILKHLSEENILEYMFSSYMGIHIPQSLCTVLPNE